MRWLVVVIALTGCKKKPADEPPPEPSHPSSGHSVTKLKDDGGAAATATPGKPGGPPLDGVSAVSVGSDRACAIATDDKLWCWAPNEPAALVETPGSVLAIANATCALLDDKTVQCGSHRISVASGNDKGAGQIAASATDVCAAHRLFVWCWKPDDDKPRINFDWGGVDRLVVANGKVCSVVSGAAIECADIVEDTKPTSMPEPQNVATLAIGGGVWCVAHTKGTVECWVDPNQRTEITGISGATQIAVGPNGDACAVIGGGAVACWHMSGSSFDAGSVKVISGLSGVTSFAVGDGYGCAVGDDHKAMCWDRSGAGKPVAKR